MTKRPLGTRSAATDRYWEQFFLAGGPRGYGCTWNDIGLTAWSICGRRRARPRQEPRDTPWFDQEAHEAKDRVVNEALAMCISGKNVAPMFVGVSVLLVEPRLQHHNF